jgi:hypothetical protein
MLWWDVIVGLDQANIILSLKNNRMDEPGRANPVSSFSCTFDNSLIKALLVSQYISKLQNVEVCSAKRSKAKSLALSG